MHMVRELALIKDMEQLLVFLKQKLENKPLTIVEMETKEFYLSDLARAFYMSAKVIILVIIIWERENQFL